jgi:hypothetical protein
VLVPLLVIDLLAGNLDHEHEHEKERTGTPTYLIPRSSAA